MRPARECVFVVHHNPSNRKYRYDADPTDAVASANALVVAGEDGWVAGNCHRLIQRGDLVLFKFGGARLQQEPGIYAAARVTQSPAQRAGVWRFRFLPDSEATKRLCTKPITGKTLERLVGRSFGASVQRVPPDHVGELLRMMPAVPPLERVESPPGNITHGLVIMKEPLDLILAGKKTWEIRGKATERRGRIALIESGTGLIKGTCDVVDVVGPVSLPQLRRKCAEWGSKPTSLPYDDHTYGWVIEAAQRLAEPVPYKHPSGAVIWVKLSPSTGQRVAVAAASMRARARGGP